MQIGAMNHPAYYLPVGSPFAEVRNAALDEFWRALTKANEIGAAVMNAHYRPVPKFFTAEQAIEWHADTLSIECDEAAQLGVTIVLEHVPHGGADQLEQFVEIMERVPLLRFHLDSGHAKVEAGSDRWGEYLA